MDQEHFNNGYESSARIIFYLIIGTPIASFILAGGSTFLIIFGAILLLFGLDFILQLMNESSSEKKELNSVLDEYEEKLPDNIPLNKNVFIRIFSLFSSKRKQEEFIGDILEIKEFLREKKHSNFMINVFLVRHVISIILIQIKFFFIRIFSNEKSKEKEID